MPLSRKLRVAIICGGQSAEHEISLLSAKNIYHALDKEKYEPILIGIDKQGQWLLPHAAHLLLEAPALGAIAWQEQADKLAPLSRTAGKQIVNFTHPEQKVAFDVVFPIVHGPRGEDGTLQGLLKLADVPFVGSGVPGSAIGMDKDVMKRLLRDAGLPVGKFITVKSHEVIDFATVVEKLGLPFFIKPANMGSSVGIHKVKCETDFLPALRDAFQYDHKVIVEEYIQAREIECAVLGNNPPLASVAGELIIHHEFYSYQAKYEDAQGATPQIPADLPPEVMQRIQHLAIKAFQVLESADLARVDFFVTANDEILINEINTLPGFTAISMYPKLWEASGIPPAELMDRLITLALERYRQEKSLI